MYDGKCGYDIGVLDDKYVLYQEHIILKSKSITPHIYFKLNKLFNKYLITIDTEIDFLDNIEECNVLRMYISIRN